MNDSQTSSTNFSNDYHSFNYVIKIQAWRKVANYHVVQWIFISIHWSVFAYNQSNRFKSKWNASRIELKWKVNYYFENLIETPEICD